jgi:hypothetical protein
MTRSMLLVALALSVAAPALAQPPATDGPRPSASIAGHVTAADTGRPIRGAVVSALSWEVMRVPKTAATDAQGRFELTGLLPGRYELSTSATGYLPLQLLGGGSRAGESLPPVDLEEGRRFDKAEIVLHRPLAIEGRLLDEFGDPAPNMMVQVMRFEYAAGRRRLMPASGRTGTRLTDDRGHFRVFGLPPGSYFVTALAGAFAEGAGPSGFVPTYYPGTADVSAARPVQVTLGESTPEITVPLVAGPTSKIAGTLLGGDGKPVSRGTIMLMVRDSLRSAAFMVARAPTNPDGSFTFRNVPAGAYTLQCWGPPIGSGGNLNASEFGSLPVALSGPDVTGLLVRTSRNWAARGRVVFEPGTAAPPPAQQVRVAGRPVEFDTAPFAGGPNPVQMHDDYTFEILNLSGSWIIRADIQSPDWTMKRVMLDGKDVTDTPLEFKDKDVDGLEVLLTTKNASVAGSVADGSGRPVGGYSVIVFAVDPARWTFPSRFIALGRPNQDGRFKIAGLPPEDYLVVAVPALQGSEWQDPDYLESLRSFAQSLTLSEGEARTLDLKLKR